MDGFLQAWNYSSHLPLIPFPLWRLHGQSAGFLCAPHFPLNQNNYGIISFLSTSTSPPPSPPPTHLSISPSFFDLQNMAQSLMAGGSIGSLSQSVSGCVWRIWNGMEWDGLAVCSNCIQSFSEGCLLWRVV